MRKIIVTFVIAFFSCIYSSTGIFAQMDQGQLAIGGASDDYAYAIVQATDGGYVMAGKTDSYGAGFTDFYMVKIDKNGNLKWTKTIGGSNYDFAYGLTNTKDGGYAATGITQTYGAGMDDVYVVKLDSNGNLQWTKTIGGTSADDGYSILQTEDSGYAIGAWTRSYGSGNDVYIIRLDPRGNKLWTQTIAAGEVSNVFMIATKQKGFAITGTGYNTISLHYDAFLITLDSMGGFLRGVFIEGPADNYGTSLVQTKDYGYVVAGYTDSYGAGNYDAWVVKIDSSGNTVEWSKTIGGIYFDGASSITKTKDGGFVTAGSSSSYSTANYNVYVVKLDSAGNLKWTTDVGGAGDDEATSVIAASDGGYAVAGYTNSFGAGGYDMYFVKLDSAGNGCSSALRDSGKVGTGATINTGIGPTGSDSGRVNTGGIEDSGGIITNSCILTSTKQLSVVSNHPDSYRESVYPNPSTGIFTFQAISHQLSAISQIEVFDVLGEKVFSQFIVHSSSFIVDLRSQPSGVYFYRVISSDGAEIGSGKMVVEK